MAMKKPGRGRSLLVRMAGVFLLFIGDAPAEEQEYKPVRAPMMPGVRRVAGKVKKDLARAGAAEAGGDMLFAADLASESLSGASNYAAALGNGRLSVAISPWADLVVFRWPSTTYSDHLRYFTRVNSIFSSRPRPVRIGQDAPSADWRRYGRPFEPCPGLGSGGGLLLPNNEVTWLGDPSWTSDRSFEPEDATILVTRLDRPGAEVSVADWVDPEYDLMVRSFRIHGPARRFFYHATFAPWKAKSGEYTQTDPPAAGFAAVYLPEDDVVVHLQPEVRNLRQARRIYSGARTGHDLEKIFPEGGIFVAWGFVEKAEGFQVGADSCKRRVEESSPLAGRLDAADGELSDRPAFIGPVDAALSVDLPSAAEKSVTVIIAVADSAQKAVDLVKSARAEGVSALREKVVAHWQAVSGRIHLPAAPDPVIRRVIRRSILNLIQGQDAQHGSIVASLSRQPHYHFDWPRDGAFFDLALDLAGLGEAVSRHHEFYARTQLTAELAFAPVFVVNYRSGWYNPSGHWPSNMAPDGSVGSMTPLMPFEIDETGLLLWDFWRHERSLAEAERPAYIGRMKPVLERAAEALLRYVDVEKGWVLPALEDDNFPPESTLHGAASVLAGLAGACDAGRRWGVSPDKVAKWCAAAKALRAGIRGRSVLPQTLDEAGFRGLAWTLWPAPVFEDYNEAGARAVKERLARSIREKADKERGGFAYLGEEVFTLALADAQGEYRDLLLRTLTLLAHEVAFPGTDCYGEVTVWGDFAGAGRKVAQQRTSIPHLWNGVTVYLSAVAIFEPQTLMSRRPPVPR